MQRLVISDFPTGYETDEEPFKINNDAFQVLNNSRIYRNKVIKKPGTLPLGRARRDLTNQNIGARGASPWTFDLGTLLGDADAEIVPDTVIFTLPGPIVFTDQGDGTLTSATPGNSGVINYSTGVVTLTHTAGAGDALVTLSYYPGLPILGAEDFQQGIEIPDTIVLDQKYSYRFNQSTKQFYDITFYKGTKAPFVWSGADYQQFWGTPYRNALWVTNNKPGFHFLKLGVADTIVNSVGAGQPTTFNVANHGLQTNDRIFVNEVQGVDDASGVNCLNGNTYIVTRITANQFTVPEDTFTCTPHVVGTGMFQYLTRSLSNSIDGIRYYDGDPTGGVPPTNNGWINFAPPLQNTGLEGGSPDYLVGAKAIVAFKDRLLMFGVWIQKSTGNAAQFENRMVYSQNGTPYYINDTNFLPLNQGGEGEAWFQNVPARGGFLGYFQQEPFINASPDGDVLITEFEESKARLIFSGDDSFPFYYQTIDNELGSLHTFSGIPLDKGILSIGDRGITYTTANSCQRIDALIPDQVFDISKFNFDEERVTAIRDYANEYVYWAYTREASSTQDDVSISQFPTKILGYSYKFKNWFTEDCHFTHFGYFYKNETYTWGTLPFDTWAEWTKPWNYGGTGARFPSVIAGNMQGFVRIYGDSAKEAPSHYIQAISGNTITSPNHGMMVGDYIIIESGTGITIDGLNLPSDVRAVIGIIDKDNFTVDGTAFTGTLNGNGLLRKVINYDIRTKMFPNFWGEGLGVEISEQKYLFSVVPEGQTSVWIYTNMNDNYAVNSTSYNSYTPTRNAIKLQGNDLFLKGASENYVWKQYSGSFSGNTVQIQFQMSDSQMRDKELIEKDFILHAIVADVSAGAEL